MLCKCGCGRDAGVYPRTRGDQKKGQEREWIRGHWARGQRTTIEPPNPSGICQCGCGQPAPIATITDERAGHVAGEPQRFIRGHRGKVDARDRLTEDLWDVRDFGYETPCWISKLAPVTPEGYTRVKFKGRLRGTHRAVYEQEVGPIPDGMQLDHLCRNPACVNPAHLDPVTPAENIQRGNNAKLTPGAVNLIRSSPLPAHRLATLFGVATTTIEDVLNGRSWRNV